MKSIILFMIFIFVCGCSPKIVKDTEVIAEDIIEEIADEMRE